MKIVILKKLSPDIKHQFFPLGLPIICCLVLDNLCSFNYRDFFWFCFRLLIIEIFNDANYLLGLFFIECSVGFFISWESNYMFIGNHLVIYISYERGWLLLIKKMIHLLIVCIKRWQRRLHLILLPRRIETF